MDLFTISSAITVTCNKRLTPFLEKEVRELGFVTDDVFVTGVRIKGTMEDCIRLNLNLRCASQVLFSLKKINAPDADAVFNELLGYPWENVLPPNTYFSVTSNVSNDTINNSMYANLRVKDAIVDRLRSVRGERPPTGSELSGAVIHLFWKQNDAEVFVDTSGESLARHGYRKFPGRAPMLEALAASVVMATEWEKSGVFLNPMCGSGTLAIEAAMIATNRRPGLFKTNFSFMHLLGYDEQIYLREDRRLEDQILDVPSLKIIATDYSGQAISNARKNAIAAGVADLIDFSVCDFSDTPVPEGQKGVMVINPEYGERLGNIAALEATYAGIGDFMKKRLGGYLGYVFTGNLELAKKIGLKAKRKIEFYTSTIDCRLLEYELYEGSRSTARS